MVGLAHQCGASAKATVNKHLQGPNTIPGVTRARATTRRQESTEAIGFHKVHLVVNTHGGVIRLDALIGGQGLFPRGRT